MTSVADLTDPAPLAELTPVLRRVVELDARALGRLRLGAGRAAILVRLPFGVLVSRTVTLAEPVGARDATVAAHELLAWLDGTRTEPPEPRDEQWRWAVPPDTGWRRLDTVPGEVVRDLVGKGARTLDEAALREGVPGAQPRTEAVEALLDAVVLTVSADDGSAEAPVTLRLLSALTRMGFLRVGSHVAVDVAGRWTRVAADYGSVYAERPGAALRIL